MRILLIDIDTLRADHLGCYGYGRDTSPAIDRISGEGMRFDRYYCPNAPCLPSRASLITGLYGMRTGVVGHGGTAADMRLQGQSRGFTDQVSENSLFSAMSRAGLHTASFSTFPQRHSAWWFNAGLNGCYNAGGRGMESAEAVTPHVLEWLDRKGARDNWFLHVHYWDPHTPYRAPESLGNPFVDTPLADDWISKDVFNEHLRHVGPHSANEISMWDDTPPPRYPRHPGKLASLADVKNFIDQYDCGVRYADENVAQIITRLERLGVYDDVAVIVTSDHGENMGELGIYGEHATADHPTCRIPMIVRWPGGKIGADMGLRDNVDLLPTLMELLGVNTVGNYVPDGRSFAGALCGQADSGKESLVLTQCCHVCQRGARFGDYLYLRTVHGGYHLLPDEMLFNIALDPHQCHDLAPSHPELCAIGAKIILDWIDAMMKFGEYDVDPMWTVMREGGPEHCRGQLGAYIERLRGTARADRIPELMAKYPGEF